MKFPLLGLIKVYQLLMKVYWLFEMIGCSYCTDVILALIPDFIVCMGTKRNHTHSVAVMQIGGINERETNESGRLLYLGN